MTNVVIEKNIIGADDSTMGLVKIVCLDMKTKNEEIYVCNGYDWDYPAECMTLFNAETKQFECRECVYADAGEIIGFGKCFKTSFTN